MNFGDVLEKPISYPRHFSCFAFTLIDLAFQSRSENDLDYTIFFPPLTSLPVDPVYSFTGFLTPAICCKTTVRRVCSASSCQAFGINSLFSIPPTPCHAGLCEISSRKQWLFRTLLLLLLNLSGCLKRDWTKTAQAQGLPVLSRKLFWGTKYCFYSKQIIQDTQLSFLKGIIKMHLIFFFRVKPWHF